MNISGIRPSHGFYSYNTIKIKNQQEIHPVKQDVYINKSVMNVLFHYKTLNMTVSVILKLYSPFVPVNSP